MSTLTDTFKNAGEKEPVEPGILDTVLYSDSPFMKEAGRVSADLPPPPPPIQKFLKSIESLPPFEKTQLIHQYTLDFMISQKENTAEGFPTFQEILDKRTSKDQKHAYGDCDVKTSFEMALFRYAGFPEQDLEALSATFQYDTESEDGLKSEAESHAALVITIDNKNYLADSNLRDLAPLNSSLTVKGTSSGDWLPVTVKIYTPTSIINAEGDLAVYPENNKKRVEQQAIAPARP